MIPENPEGAKRLFSMLHVIEKLVGQPAVAESVGEVRTTTYTASGQQTTHHSPYNGVPGWRVTGERFVVRLMASWQPKLASVHVEFVHTHLANGEPLAAPRVDASWDVNGDPRFCLVDLKRKIHRARCNEVGDYIPPGVSR